MKLRLAAFSILLLGAYASRDVVLPVAGRAGGAGGRLYLTALWITNPSERDSVVCKLTFRPAAEKLPPHESSLTLKPAETRVIDPIDATILGVADALGSLRIEATHDVLATARVYSAGVATSFNAIPVQFAIRSNESTTLQGIAPADGRYKLFIAEVAGAPLDLTLSLLDGRGVAIASKQIYIDRDRQVTTDIADLFPQFTSGTATLRIDGMNGDGRVIVAGSQIARDTQDSTPFEMSFTTTPRDRVGVLEALTYIAVAAAAVVALVVRR